MQQQNDGRIQALLALINIPVRYRTATWDYVSPEGVALGNFEYARAVRKFVDNWPDVLHRGANLYLYGSYGTGKSALAAMVLRDVAMRYRVAGYWMPALRLKDAVIEKWVHADDRLVWDWCLSAPLLVLDDMIFDSSSKFQGRQIEIAVRHRLESMLPTIVTSNLSPEMLTKTYPALGGAMDGSYILQEVDNWNFRRDTPAGGR